MSTGPARIKPHADPRTRRLTGTTVHGFIPFDVPVVTEITDGLWQGGCQADLILPDFVEHLVSLYPQKRYRVRHKLASELAVRMDDSTGQALDQVPAIAAWVNACRAGGPVLIHCESGLNRSSLVTAMALMLGGMTADGAIALLREKRSPACLCNPAFEEWLRGYEDTVRLTSPLAVLWPGGPRGTIATRAYNRLLRQGFGTVGQLAACTPDDLLGLHDFGHGQLREVQRVLAAAGLALQGEAAAS